MESTQLDLSRLRHYVAASLTAQDAMEAARERLRDARKAAVPYRSHLTRLRDNTHPTRMPDSYRAAIALAEREFNRANADIARMQAAYDAAASIWRLAKRHEEDCRAYALARGVRLPNDASFTPHVLA